MQHGRVRHCAVLCYWYATSKQQANEGTKWIDKWKCGYNCNSLVVYPSVCFMQTPAGARTRVSHAQILRVVCTLLLPLPLLLVVVIVHDSRRGFMARRRRGGCGVLLVVVLVVSDGA